ncbi:MAG: Ig-like domain-containing protein [Vicinamibacteria bacterium]|nr:Ig-like domain-containing protein [Vicinamibacteria bacterium]
MKARLSLALALVLGWNVAVAEEPPRKKRIELTLEDARPAPAATPAPPPKTRPLDPAAAARLFERLPALPQPSPVAARLPRAATPPPKPGERRTSLLPPAARPAPAPAAAALKVELATPQGEVERAANLSVTFSQPMIAVASLDAVAAEQVPVKLSPQPPGKWRWVGTRTLLFEPEGGFPQATSYAAEVPAGTKALDGTTLARPYRFTFGTPPPKLRSSQPRGTGEPRQPLLFVRFDQRMDADVILAAARLHAPGTAVLPALRAASTDEIAADETVAALVEEAPPGTFAVLRPEAALPADTAVTVRFAAGLRSAEGPRPTTQAIESDFRTHGALRLVEARCGWGREAACPPGTPWRLEFSNRIDEEAFSADLVAIEPALPDARIEVHGQTLMIAPSGARRGAYRVNVAGRLRDVYGQVLEASATAALTVAPAPPWAAIAGGELAVLEPGAPLRLYTTNVTELRVEIRRVDPADWPAWTARYDEKVPLPGRVVLTRVLRPEAAADTAVETRVDLAEALEQGLGQLLVSVEWTRAEGRVAAESRRERRPTRQWLQVTRLGLEALAGPDSVLAWASALADGAALAGATAALAHAERDDERPAAADLPGVVTDAHGLATLPLDERSRGLLVVRHGDDVGLLPAYRWGGGWARRAPAPPLRAYAFDDRGLYQPGESARVKGWVRRIAPGPRGDVEAAGLRALDWTLHDARGRELAKGTAELGAVGGFDLSLAFPEDCATGDARLSLRAEGQEIGGLALKVQEFRRPEFEVAIERDAPEAVVGEAITLAARAAYFGGGGLGAAPARWEITRETARFAPPGLDDFAFGTAPSWFPRDDESAGPGRWEFAGTTDVEGVHRLRLTASRLEPEEPLRLVASVSVEDVNRQAWSASSSFMVHPARVAPGLRLARRFVRAGEALEVDALVSDLSGGKVAGRPLEVAAERVEWRREKGRHVRAVAESRSCSLTSAAEPQRCRFADVKAGAWRITARTTDDRGRGNVTRVETWVAGAGLEAGPLDAQEAKLVADRKEYAPGDTAELLVLAPFWPAHGLLRLEREGLAETLPFQVDGPTAVVRVPLAAAYMPAVEAAVTLVGRGRDEDGREGPVRATGETTLAVPTTPRRLSVTARPADAETSPGAETAIALELKDGEGRPVAGEVTVAVVDDAVFTLGGGQQPDPLGAFHARRWGGISPSDSRSLVVAGRPDLESGVEGGVVGGVAGGIAEMAMAPQAAPAPMARKGMAFEAPSEEPAAPVALRSDFSPLAAFFPSVRTDAEGLATVGVKLPDSVTRWRVIAVAAEGANRFGTGEASLVARLPLAVRPSPPRFLNLGDRFELPVVVQNQTDAPAEARVALRAANLGLGTAAAGQVVTVPARDRVEVRFPARAEAPGEAAFQAAAAAAPDADAAQLALPVLTPASAEAFATYGVVERGAVAEGVRAPADALAGFGGLELSLSPTALSSLADAALYLKAYPFECAEQVASRLLGLVAMRDVLPALGASDLPSREETDRALGRAVTRLVSLQNGDGGFGFWVRGGESWPWLSAHATHALARARAAGLEVPAATLERAKRYLRALDGRRPDRGYDASAWRAIRAYALHVRGLLGDRDAKGVRALAADAAAQGPLEALGLLLPLLADDAGGGVERAAALQAIANRASITAATATLAERYSESGPLVLHSSRRSDAIALDGLLAAEPKHPLVEKLVAGLQAGRVGGRWATTQENAFVLLALARYFRAFESAAPDFSAAAWLGAASVGEAAFRGRTASAQHWSVPMDALLAAGSGELVLAKDGRGRLHYRLGLRYVPASLELPAYEAGFSVVRRYEAVDDPADVRRDADGTWHVRAGARVRVKLDLVAPARRHHVALVDPLPAGFEPLNPELPAAGAPSEPDRPLPLGFHWRWYFPRWYVHQNLRDDRAEAFATTLWAGVHEYSYVARATTPGTFLAPNPRAEEMYAPETFGRGAADRVVIE